MNFKDPADPKLKAHFLSQLERKYDQIKNFEGLVVDRSDWNSIYNHDYDDAVSFVNNKTAHLAQYSYADTIDAMRAIMDKRQGSTKAGQTVMLQNANGFVQLSLLKSFDGTFSEGGIVNAVGILGARSTSILWTYNSKECCGTPAVADEYFQRRLYMKVFPMAPFPQAGKKINFACTPARVHILLFYTVRFFEILFFFPPLSLYPLYSCWHQLIIQWTHLLPSSLPTPSQTIALHQILQQKPTTSSTVV